MSSQSSQYSGQTVDFRVVDVINTVITSLTTLSRTNKRPAFGSVFLLNNISYIRTKLLIQPCTDVPSLLSKPTQDILNSTFRTAKAGYFDSNFSPLMQTLLEDKDRSKSATKEKFTRFFDALEEVAERHRLTRVLQDDRESRETIKEEAVKLVVPSLQRFTQRQGKEFSKSKFVQCPSRACKAKCCLCRSEEVHQDVRRRGREPHPGLLRRQRRWQAAAPRHRTAAEQSAHPGGLEPLSPSLYTYSWLVVSE